MTELFTPEDELSWWDNAEKEKSWWQPVIKRIVCAGPIPRHVAFVMDGNRRFARTNKLGSVIRGHMKGFEQLAKILDWCRDLGVKEVTVYAFSIENFKRSEEEVGGLMALAEQMFGRLLSEKDKLEEKQIAFRFLGNVTLLSPRLRRLIAKIELETEQYTRGVINVCMPYTSRDEMARAFELIRKGREKGLLTEDQITEELISQCMDSRRSRDPDMLIRTSGEKRLSDFLLWQCSTSHIYFDDVLWPEFNYWNLCKALLSYQYHSSSIKTIRKAQEVPSGQADEDIGPFLQFVADSHQEMLKSYAAGEEED